MSLAPGIRLGPYEIVSALGSGGMGQVYQARDTRLNRVVAIKVVSPDLMAKPDARVQLAREARAVAALSHPHICALHDFGSENGIDYLVMEYLEGETIAERLMAGPLPVAEVFRYSIDIADALEHAHRRGFVHRDLKSGNVKVTKSGAVLLDFGLAKALVKPASPSTSGTETEDLTADESLRGTLPYMAPEQLEGREADARSDVFAFGALMYEMATGRRAFDGQSHASVIAAILSTAPSPIKELQPLVPSALDRIVQKCLAKDPDERWQSAHDLKTALQWISDPDWNESQVPATPAPAHRRERIAWTMAGVLLLVSMLAIAIGRGAADRNRAAPDTEPIRFSVGPPENATLFSGGGVMALSPDGRHLALVATPSGGNPLLWIRSLDSVAARPLVGTIGARQPFWSPDSRFVAFMAAGKLKKVDVTSGDVQTICEAEGDAGTWHRSGLILFKSSVTGRIEQVLASGGPPLPAALIDSSRGETWLNWPQFLPDGRHFLYFVKSTQPEFTGIYVASLDRPDRTRVLRDESQALYVPPGYLVFRREATLFAQRFDVATFTLSGDGLPLADDIAFNFATRRGVFSVSETGVLAYRTAEDSVLSWFDRQGTALGPVGPPAHYHDPAISPDGKTVAIARVDPRVGTDDIWLIDADRGAATQFTFDPGPDRAPVWSRDGTRIVFASRRGVALDLFVKSSTGHTPEELLLSSSGGGMYPVDWSHDGRFVALVRPGPNTHFDLWALPLAGDRKPFVLVRTAATDSQGQLSPDGRWLAYASDETGTFEVYVRPFPEASAGKWRISDRGGVEPKWRHDGKELFYLGADQRLMTVSVRTTSSFEAGAPAALFETRAIGSQLWTIGRNQYDVAPNGRFLINAPALGSSTPITIVVNWPATLSR